MEFQGDELTVFPYFSPAEQGIFYRVMSKSSGTVTLYLSRQKSGDAGEAFEVVLVEGEYVRDAVNLHH
jgi:hypothetical protein